MSKVSSGSLRLSGNAFQTDGLATENARQPNGGAWPDKDEKTKHARPIAIGYPL